MSMAGARVVRSRLLLCCDKTNSLNVDVNSIEDERPEMHGVVVVRDRLPLRGGGGGGSWMWSLGEWEWERGWGQLAGQLEE